ncbi:HAMP domain-containing sensor histidine kinase [Saccharibacillus alkalitolerans]|uniref:histidine kinase n=1 Tax=Saccharibacillus alkalitolerans TaxID=2705290 RepID=A0ABX0F8M3_9BACL|nr:HAMP domain-containing sensor histidine kinase [Saccharibacillus alkalitolerans]NGZ76790.1 HAMP domain-containing histidine kinase [Saccharibacillus alkalitolerans]
MEILNLNAQEGQGKKSGIRLRSVLTDFLLLTLVLASLVVLLSQITTREAASRYGILKASYWDRLPYTWQVVSDHGNVKEVGPGEWSSSRIRVYEDGSTEPRLADFTLAHKLKGGFYLFVQYTAPYAYAIVLLGGGLFLFYFRRVRQPLRTMVEAADRVASGDLDFRVGVRGRDEFGRIGEAFEKMRGGLERGSREMWRVAEERKRLNAAFSHDLRTPLAVLKGRIDLLADFYPSGQMDREETLSAISSLRRNAERLERYVSSMSSLQKLEDLEAVPGAVELTELADDLRETADTLRGSRTLDFGPVLPAVLSLDAGLVAQVFENLIANAQRFAAEAVTVRFDQTEDSLRISVVDDGPGFSPEALRRACEPYYRGGDTPADSHFGLGLYICRLLCEKHGGSLTLANAPSGGAQVTAEFRSV